MLDGWRAVSILLVLAGHLLPLGPGGWGLNGAFALGGLALFFTLSGFLITHFLLERPDVPDFLRRRLFRIVPLAWLATIILALANRPDALTVAANLLFFANLPPPRLMAGGEHLWSLCVEAQFYIAVGLLVAVGGRRALWSLPLLCVAVTLLRVATGTHASIVTWLRIDEILAGAALALACTRPAITGWLRACPSNLTLLFLIILLAASRLDGGVISYIRPYAAAGAIGVSLYSAPVAMRRLFSSRTAAYIAAISYALYVFHGMLVISWLGTGDLLVKYAKRPLLFAATFAAAHMSTFWFERPITAWGSRFASKAGVQA